ncbi:MAG: hypothetical protein ACFFB2_11125 [Promethearchaeota archaeon]
MYRSCLYLIKGEEIHYCLRLKEWNELCPQRCPFYKQGEPGSLKEVKIQRYAIDCLQLTRWINTNDEAEYWCKIYYTNRPTCHSESVNHCRWIH